MGFLDRLKAKTAKPSVLRIGEQFRFESSSPAGPLAWRFRFMEEACYIELVAFGVSHQLAVYPHVELDGPRAVTWREGKEEFVRHLNLDLTTVLRLAHEFARSIHDGSPPSRDDAEAAIKEACENISRAQGASHS